MMESSRAESIDSPDLSLHIPSSLHDSSLSFIPADPPPPPDIRYYYSKVAAKNVCYLYRVVEQRGGRFICYPEARGWPRLTFCSHKELQKSFKLLLDDQIFSCKPDPLTEPGLVRFPDLEELRMDWQLGSTVYFRHCDVRTPGKVVGRFVWMQQPCGEIGGSAMPHLRLVFLLQLPTNELLLSSQVTDLEQPTERLEEKEEVYIQGISLISVVATLIANVAYLASVDPIRGSEADPRRKGVAIASRMPLPTVFMFFNAFAFYASVLAVVLMTAFIPIYGTAGEWGAIFLSGSVPVVLGLVAFYIAYMVSAWAVLDSWGTPLGLTLGGVLMVVYVRVWAVGLMRGNVERHLQMKARYSAWEWYKMRFEEAEEEAEEEKHRRVGGREPASGGTSMWQQVSKAWRSGRSSLRRFCFSPTIWQLSVLGTVSETHKTRKRISLMFQHLEGKAH